MKTAIALASTFLALMTGAAMAQPGRDGIPMRDGSTIINVGGGCLVQFGRRNERINNAQRCSDNDLREADARMAGGGGGRPGFGGEFGGGFGGGAALPSGSWAQSCRAGQMQGQVFRTQCRDESGRWNVTVLDMRNCPTGNAENCNGSLVCH
ncbi:MAG: hypothetical protein RL274_1317 [Pseudomonadota bacterium]|jgi:hypothetical protein